MRWYLVRVACGKDWTDYLSDREAEKLASKAGFSVYALTDEELYQYDMTGKVNF